MTPSNTSYGIPTPHGSDSAYLCKLLGIQRPVLLAPMAGVSGGALAAAVSNSGGLGIVGGGYGDLDQLAIQMALADESPVGIGLINWTIDQTIVDAVLGYDPVAVWLSFGDSSPYIPSIHATGSLVICQVFTVSEAVAMAEAGADIIVAQGSEAGGHGRTGRSLFGLLPAIRAALPDTPLVAAGGINHRREFEAANLLGAAGIALGTAYYATHEALDSHLAKQRLVEATGDETIRGVVYDLVRGPEWPAEFSGRSLRSTVTDTWTGREDELRADPSAEAARHIQAATDNDMSVRVVWAGEGLDAIDAILPAREITERFPVCAGPSKEHRP